jgi:phosphate transport system ATP-binding protein
VSDFAVFFLQGEVIEQGSGQELFVNPKDKRTEDYVMGKFG